MCCSNCIWWVMLHYVQQKSQIIFCLLCWRLNLRNWEIFRNTLESVRIFWYYCRCRCSYLPFWSSFVWLIFATFVNFKPRWWTTVCQWFRRFRTRMLMQCLDLCNISGRLLYLNDNTVRMWNSQSCQWCDYCLLWFSLWLWTLWLAVKTACNCKHWLYAHMWTWESLSKMTLHCVFCTVRVCSYITVW